MRLTLSFLVAVMVKTVRVGVVGDNEVGKTAIIHQFLHQNFLEYYEPTIEDMFDAQRCQTKVEIHDLSGSRDIPETRIRKQALEHCDVILYVFALDKRDSASVLEVYRKEDKRNLPSILVCNKMDLAFEVRLQDVRNIEYSLGTISYKVCAKTGQNIDLLFDEVIRLAAEKPATKKEERQKFCGCCFVM